MRHLWFKGLFFSITLFACMAWSLSHAQDAGDIKIEKRAFNLESGETVEFEIGTIYVKENRNDPDSRVIGVGFAKFPSLMQPATGPPVFRLPGGPGGSYLMRLDATDPEEWVRRFPAMMSFREFCDVIFVDQRGYSEHGDVFRAEYDLPSRGANHASSIDDSVQAFVAFANETVAEFSKNNIDLKGYTVKECAHDVAELCEALGYNKMILNGTSFGSQWSFAIMRMYPERVTRALLSGVEPLNHGYDMPSHIFAAVQRMWQAVDNDPVFHPYLPTGGMAEAARVVIRRLEQQPIPIHVQNKDGEKQETVGKIGPADFPWRNPSTILELFHNHIDPKWADHFTGSKRRRVRLIGPLIDTSLSVTPERRFQLWNDPATRYLSRRNFASYLATEDIWPSPDVGDDFRTPVLCEIPVVFTQGDWDISTPIENTYEVMPFFPHSRLLVAHRGGHGVLGPIAQQEAAIWDQLVEFVRTGDMNDIPARVTLEPSRRFKPPSFRLESSGSN